jgi:MFS family permease
MIIRERQSVPDRLRRARAGDLGTFFVVGFVTASWLVNIPTVQANTGISHATLGLLLLLLGLGGIIGMQITGYVIARTGSKIIIAAALLANIASVNLPVHVHGPVTLGIALVVFGISTGTVDVAMNDQAVVIEREYGRPIMSAFHAFWSIGGAAGALVGAGARAIELPVPTAVLISSVIAAIAGAVLVPLLLPRALGSHQEPAASASPRTSPAKDTASSGVRNRVIGFGLLAFLLMLAEGVANDWSALHAVEHLGQPGAAAALAYATFAVAMTIGRLTIDWVAHRFGPVFVIRYGSLTSAIGMSLVMATEWYPLTLIGWAIFGFGLAGVVPQLFTAAGNISTTNQSVLLSRVVGAGYLGQLAGPALVGAAAGWASLNLAFGFPLLFCIIAVAVAPIVARPDRLTTSSPTAPAATMEGLSTPGRAGADQPEVDL